MTLKPIPPQGFEGVALREAAATEFRQVCDLVRAALAMTMGREWVEMESIYPDRVIVREQGRFYAYPYTLGADNVVTVGAKTEVVEQFVPVREALQAALTNGDVVFIEAVGAEDSGRWLIRVIRAGRSGNNNFYPDAVLREAVTLFEGARVFMKSDAEHIKGEGKAVRNLEGGLTKPRFIEGATPDTGEIQAEFVLIEPEGAVAVKLREAKKRDLTHLFGFSIDAEGVSKTEMREGVKTRVAKSIKRVHSVDLIVEPGAGGELIRLIEAVDATPSFQEKDEMSLRARMIEAIKAKKPDFDGANATDDQIETAYREAVAHEPVAADPQGAHALKSVRLVEARITARDVVSKAKLPQAAKDKVLARFTEATEPFTAADVDKAIEDERAYLSKFTESGKPSGMLDIDVQVEDRSVQMKDMLDAFFNPEHKEHRNVGSFKECYIEMTGDKRVTGLLRDCDAARMRESFGASFRESIASSTFADALGDSITRRMQAVYLGETDLQLWRRVVRVGRAADFRSQERIRMGGYGNLPAVAQGAGYTALTTPGDDKATLAVTKRGGTEDVTLETIKNDDVGIIRQIPIELALAAANTLYEFAFDFFKTNPNSWDGVALYHASHGNLFTGALSATEFAAHRLALKKQTRVGSGKRLGITAKTVLVPEDLAETAYNLFVRGTNLDKTFVQNVNPDVIAVPYWTDVTDWCTVADPQRGAVVEIDFLDGQEEPELFVQDMPNVGSMFSNDKLTYKIRHIYGGNILVDGEKFTTKAVVTG